MKRAIWFLASTGLRRLARWALAGPLVAALGLMVLARVVPLGAAAPASSPPAAPWHHVGKTALATVDVERAVYEKLGDRHFFVRVRVTNSSDRPIGVDLRGPRAVLAPRSWGRHNAGDLPLYDGPAEVLHELGQADRTRLLADFAAGRLTPVPPGKSIEYYSEFNASADVDRQRGQFLIVGMGGELRLTDGNQVEQFYCDSFPNRNAQSEVVISAPLPWKAIPADGWIVRDLYEQSWTARTKLSDLLPRDMSVTQAGAVNLETGPGLYLRAVPDERAKSRPPIALFLWPRFNPGRCTLPPGAEAQAFVQVGRSDDYIVFYSGPEDNLKARVTRAFSTDDRPTGPWHRVGETALAAVDVERALYGKAGETQFYLRVRVTNLSDRPVGADLRDPQKVIHPHRWGHPGPPLWRRGFYPPPEKADCEALRADFAAGRLATIPPGKSIDCYRRFDDGVRADVDRSGGTYLIVCLDGELLVTDGSTVEQVSYEPNHIRTFRADLVIPNPVPWREVPAGGNTLAPDAKADEAPWGEAVQGVQCRLTPCRPQWESGEVPSFRADIRNRGMREWWVALAQPLCEMELDGEWYKWVAPINARNLLLPVGKEFTEQRFSTDGPWRKVEGGQPMEVRPGKHVVRVACFPRRLEPDVKEQIRVVSNPVEIEIVAAKPPAAP